MKTDRLRLAHNGFVAGTALIAGLLSGCAWDNSPPPLHSRLLLERTATDRGWATRQNQSGTNVAIGADWQTNQIQGAGAAGYGAAGGVGTGAGSATTVGAGAGAGTTTSGGIGHTSTTGATTGPVPGTLTPTPTTSGTTTATPSSLSTLGTNSLGLPH